MEYTTQERELQELTQGPDPGWRRDAGLKDAPVCPDEVPTDLPKVGRAHLELAARIQELEEAQVIAKAPNR